MIADSELVQRTLNGDRAAFGQLIERYFASLFNFVLPLVNHQHDAEDIVQESFIRAFRRLETFQSRSEFKTWLYAIAYRLVRRKRRRKPINEADLTSPSDNHFRGGGLPSKTGSTDPKEEIDRAELVLAVRKAISELPEVYRAAVVLVDLEGLDYRSAAEVMKVPVNTVRSRLARARELLRKKLKSIL